MIPDKVLLIDGMNLFIRCFCVVPTMDTNGNPTGELTTEGTSGFINKETGLLTGMLSRLKVQYTLNNDGKQVESIEGITSDLVHGLGHWTGGTVHDETEADNYSLDVYKRRK